MIVFDAATPVIKRLVGMTADAAAPAPTNVFHAVSATVPVLDLPNCNLVKPPALKKLKKAELLANVIVLVKVIVQAEPPEPVAVVLLCAPLSATVVPLPAAL